MAQETTVEEAKTTDAKEAPKLERVFLGGAWKNKPITYKGEEIEVLNMRFDQTIAKVTIEFKEGDRAIVIGSGDNITLWPNDNKREGKMDKDYSVSVQLGEPESPANAQ